MVIAKYDYFNTPKQRIAKKSNMYSKDFLGISFY